MKNQWLTSSHQIKNKPIKIRHIETFHKNDAVNVLCFQMISSIELRWFFISQDERDSYYDILIERIERGEI